MKILSVVTIALALIGCSEGFKTNPTVKKVSGLGGSTGLGSGGTTGGTSTGGTGGTSSGGTSSGGTTGNGCTAGARGTLPDLAGLVSTYQSQHGSQITADCTTGSRQFITGLVQFLRGQGQTRVGYTSGMNDGDKLVYLWDNGNCEGSTNTTLIDTLGAFCASNVAQWMTVGTNVAWTLTPPGNGSPETGSGTGGSTGTTGGGKVSPPGDMSGFVRQISDANPGMINDCTGQPIANNFLLTVVRALQAQDPRWGFMVKDGGARVPRDILAYRSSDEMDGTHNFYVIDFVSSGCGNSPNDPGFADPATNAGVYWNLLNASDGYASNGVWQFNP